MLRLQYEVTVPPAPRLEDMTDEEYEQSNESYQYDVLRDLLLAARDIGIGMREL